LEHDGTKEARLVRSFLAAGSAGPRASELALASLRVVPRNRTRIQVALCLKAEGDAGAARGVLEEVLSRKATPRDGSNACANLGFVLASQGASREARQWYARGSAYPVARPFCLLSWFSFALAAGDRPEVEHASRAIAERVSEDDPEVQGNLANLEDDVRTGHWKPVEATRRLADGLAERGGAVVRRIIDVVK
jgi:hypothetical protein